MKSTPIENKGLPKFNTNGWLGTGILFSLLLFGTNVWSLIVWRDAPFLPVQFTQLLGTIVGLVLGVHCVDMIFYHRKNSKHHSLSRRVENANCELVKTKCYDDNKGK